MFGVLYPADTSNAFPKWLEMTSQRLACHVVGCLDPGGMFSARSLAKKVTGAGASVAVVAEYQPLAAAAASVDCRAGERPLAEQLDTFMAPLGKHRGTVVF